MRMLRLLRHLAKRLRYGSLERGDFSSASDRPVENLDAMTASRGGDDDAFPGNSGYPPGYVKAYDEGRPRK
jgi:hypothetical protein